MFVKNIKYIDFNGKEREEEFAFHLSLPEVTRMQAKYGEDLAEYAKKVVAEGNHVGLIEFIEEMILTSYGKKTADGRSFHKTKELRQEFEYSQAYAEFFEELMTNPKLQAEFGSLIADNGKKRNAVAPQVVQ